MGKLTLVPRDDGTDVLHVVDSANGALVGQAIPSDVYPGKWRAAVRDPGAGFSFVCETGAGEKLVDRSQNGTETFGSAKKAKEAIARHRMY